jgi:sn-glycerol 3-phosphate transport system substrate-binding protein
MKNIKKFISVISITGLLIGIICMNRCSAKKTIVVWHAMDSVLGKIFNEIVDDYNKISLDIEIKPVFKGTYDQTLDAVINQDSDSEEKEARPHIAQIYEMGTRVMHQEQQKRALFKSLPDVMKTIGAKLDDSLFLPTIAQFYRARATELCSLPFNASTVILFYNKTKFDELGLVPPTTWELFQDIAKSLKEHGAQNVLGAGWLHGHFIDQSAAWHNQAVATQGNGVDGDDARLCLNSPFFNRHFSALHTWHQNGWLTLKSASDVEKAFVNEEIVMLLQGSNRLPIIQAMLHDSFEVGVAALPYWSCEVEKPYNTIAGGASFWALDGYDQETYQAIAHFFQYLISVDIQMKWHQQSGYIPVIQAAYQAIRSNSFPYKSALAQQAALVAIESLLSQSQEFSRGILLPKFPEIRKIMLDEMSAAIRGDKPVRDALEAIDLLSNRCIGI